jgi:hypothetical protein
MVITATSVIKIWIRKQPEKRMESMSESRGHPTSSSGLSVKQMLTLLIFAVLLNFLSHSQVVLDLLCYDRLATVWNNVANAD